MIDDFDSWATENRDAYLHASVEGFLVLLMDSLHRKTLSPSDAGLVWASRFIASKRVGQSLIEVVPKFAPYDGGHCSYPNYLDLARDLVKNRFPEGKDQFERGIKTAIDTFRLKLIPYLGH